jgi:hypothetical protein
MDAKRGSEIERQIEKVKRELSALRDLRPGNLSTQYNVCGSPGYRCKATPPKKHGPYHQVSFSRKGKSSTKFICKEDLPPPQAVEKLRKAENSLGSLDRSGHRTIRPAAAQARSNLKSGELGTVQIGEVCKPHPNNLLILPITRRCRS